ncbi:capsular polysaccharide transport system permease protein [Brevundimonas nasdae]|uniref:ABC transporter permease n=1 Tax=Brevundimonas nasdae TaxID=172043 RepID=UPI001913F33B|nr:ABC transporter permease [Brevundimonas nasdae]MBK6025178.1 ABC transporter permease [Brevundimonas nasdae]MDQ0452041.1 capsular polysaccharide transport system permease protein [Brevundimonas nasdae]
MVVAEFRQHSRVIGALLMREMTTRFGREGIGFLWLVGEPMLFCGGVIALWSLVKPTFASEHGLRLAPFVMTGYMCLILMRHLISLLTPAVQSNVGLLYHRFVTPTHILATRILLEIAGGTLAFVILYAFLGLIQQVQPPENYPLLYAGWGVIAFCSTGLGLIMTGLVMRYEIIERVVGLVSYLLMPVSGAFFMVAWLPPSAQKVMMYIPFVHGTEAIRGAIFGEFVETHYDLGYALVVGAIMNIIGLLIIYSSLDRIEVE